MTYRQVLEEFEKCEHLETGMCDIEVAKSFLKQSFIKYLQGEVERHKKQVKINQTIIDTHVVCPRNWHEGRITEAKMNITFLQAQIKEIEETV